MKKTVRAAAVLMCLVMIIAMFSGCGEQTERPVEAKVKTDLHDAVFTLTYGDLRKVLPGDKLASLFELTNKKTDDKTVELTYYDLVSKYGSEECFGDVCALLKKEDLAALTGNQEQALDYFNKLINDIKKNNTAQVLAEEHFRISHGDGVAFKNEKGELLPEQDVFKAAFRIYADNCLKNIDSYLMNAAEPTGEVLYRWDSDIASELTLSDLYTDEKTYPIYTSVIPDLAYQLDENGKNAEDENGEYIFVPTELQRTVVITVKPEEECVKKAFSIRRKDKIMEEMKKAENYMKVNSYEIGFAPCKITAGINAATDEMTYATYEKNMIITANVTFTGALEKYGNVIVEFPCTGTVTYNFGWASNAE